MEEEEDECLVVSAWGRWEPEQEPEVGKAQSPVVNDEDEESDVVFLSSSSSESDEEEEMMGDPLALSEDDEDPVEREKPKKLRVITEDQKARRNKREKEKRDNMTKEQKMAVSQRRRELSLKRKELQSLQPPSDQKKKNMTEEQKEAVNKRRREYDRKRRRLLADSNDPTTRFRPACSTTEEKRAHLVKTFANASLMDKMTRLVNSVLISEKEKKMLEGMTYGKNRKRVKGPLDLEGIEGRRWRDLAFFQLLYDVYPLKKKFAKEAYALEFGDEIPSPISPDWINWGQVEWERFISNPAEEDSLQNEELDNINDWIAAQVAEEGAEGEQAEQHIPKGNATQVKHKVFLKDRIATLTSEWEETKKEWEREAPSLSEKRRELDAERKQFLLDVKSGRPLLAMACAKSLAVRRLLLSKESVEERKRRIDKERAIAVKMAEARVDKHAREGIGRKLKQPWEKVVEDKATISYKANTRQKFQKREYDLYLELLAALSFPAPVREKDEKRNDFTRFIPPSTESQETSTDPSHQRKVEEVLREKGAQETVLFWGAYKAMRTTPSVKYYRTALKSLLVKDIEEEWTKDPWTVVKHMTSEDAVAREVSVTEKEVETLRLLLVKSGEEIMNHLSLKRWYQQNIQMAVWREKGYPKPQHPPQPPTKGSTRYDKLLAWHRRRYHLKKHGVDIGLGNYWDRNSGCVVEERTGRGGYPLKSNSVQEEGSIAVDTPSSKPKVKKPTGRKKKSENNVADISPASASTSTHSHWTRAGANQQRTEGVHEQYQSQKNQSVAPIVPTMAISTVTHPPDPEEPDWLPFSQMEYYNPNTSRPHQLFPGPHQFLTVPQNYYAPFPGSSAVAAAAVGDISSAYLAQLNQQMPQHNQPFFQLVTEDGCNFPATSFPSNGNEGLSTSEPAESYQDYGDDDNGIEWDEVPPPSSPEDETLTTGRKRSRRDDEDWQGDGDNIINATPSRDSSSTRKRAKTALRRTFTALSSASATVTQRSSHKKRSPWLLHKKGHESLFPSKRKRDPSSTSSAPTSNSPLDRNPITIRDAKLSSNLYKLLPKCEKCGEIFRRESSLQLHMKTKHSTAPATAPAPASDPAPATTTKTESTTVSKPSTTPASTSDLECSLCLEKFRRAGKTLPTNYADHLFNYHYEVQGSLSCPLSSLNQRLNCFQENRTFGSRQLLINHLTGRHSEDVRERWIMGINDIKHISVKAKFVCLYCKEEGSEYPSFEDLKGHYKETHERRRWPCPTCGLCVRNRDHLIDHLRVFHPQEVLTNATVAATTLSYTDMERCDSCDCEFLPGDFLKKHEKEGHSLGGKVGKRAVKKAEGDCNYSHAPYKCELCRDAFISLYNLRLHSVRLHGLMDYLKGFEAKGIILPPLPAFLEENISPNDDNDPETAVLQAAKEAEEKGKLVATTTSVTCPTCGINTPWSLHSLHLLHEKVRKCYCPPCDRVFSRAPVLKMHNEASHNIPLEDHQDPPLLGCPAKAIKEKGGMVRCNECTRYYSAEEIHEMHCLAERNPGHRKCQYCDKVFEGEGGYLKHIHRYHGVWKRKTNKDDFNSFKEVRKELLPEDFNKLSATIIIPLANNNITTLTIYSCRVCLKNFQTRDFLHTHISTAHQKDAFTRVLCPDCKLTFASAENLRQHKMSQHDPSAIRFGCPLCPTHFFKKSYILKHASKYHKGVDIDLDEIKMVPLSEVKEDPLKRHICELCGKGVGTEEGLRSHMTNTHFPTHASASFCPHCGLQATPSALRCHIVTSHKDKLTKGENPAGKKDKAYTKVPLLQILEMIEEAYGQRFLTRKGKSKAKKEKQEDSDDDCSAAESSSEEEEEIIKPQTRRKFKGKLSVNKKRQSKTSERKGKISVPDPDIEEGRSIRKSTRNRKRRFHVQDLTSGSEEDDIKESSVTVRTRKSRRLTVQKAQPEKVLDKTPVLILERCDSLLRTLKNENKKKKKEKKALPLPMIEVKTEPEENEEEFDNNLCFVVPGGSSDTIKIEPIEENDEADNLFVIVPIKTEAEESD